MESVHSSVRRQSSEDSGREHEDSEEEMSPHHCSRRVPTRQRRHRSVERRDSSEDSDCSPISLRKSRCNPRSVKQESSSGSSAPSSPSSKTSPSPKWSPLKSVLRSLSLNTLFVSEPPPQPKSKSILRAPATCTYVKGLSGLPTRVPLNGRSPRLISAAEMCSLQHAAAIRALCLDR